MPKVKVISECLDLRGKGFQAGKVIDPPKDAPECDKYFFRFKGARKKDNQTIYVTLKELAIIALICQTVIPKFMEDK